jgi:hypothetical protein
MPRRQKADEGGMIWIAIGGMVLAGWSMLSILGNERQRRITELKQRAELEAEAARRAAEEVPVLSAAGSQ